MSVRIRRGGALGAVLINSNSLNPVQNGLLFDLSAKYYGIAESGISTSVWPDLTENQANQEQKKRRDQTIGIHPLMVTQNHHARQMHGLRERF